MRCYSVKAPGVYFGAYAVVFADTEEQARELAFQALNDATGGVFASDIEMKELDIDKPAAYVLWNGDY